jgi:hypothetical protein
MGSVVVISGPIGAGKTTVARALIEATPPPLAYIEGDDFWRYLVKPQPGGPPRNIRAIMPAMFRAAAGIAADDYQAILDFSLPPAFVRAACARLAGSVVHYVELRPALAVCAARRGADARRDRRLRAVHGLLRRVRRRGAVRDPQRRSGGDRRRR